MTYVMSKNVISICQPALQISAVSLGHLNLWNSVHSIPYKEDWMGPKTHGMVA